ncbi:hypothetical protein BCR34DRAFT_597140 [Clohesyomyces aquaticus]|uniref:Actin-like ATPase domain-containing protein n=1 Tax=Clohesyomyces aquaticus TaxID=1231657 RepID=A0A1Y2A3F9_9PLEO|nr:hypothetical protein BCR34DRAFT_597140 [Clohesyomyces aquaticus]
MIAELQDKYDYGPGFCTVPEGKSAKDVVTDYLQCLYSHFVETISGRDVNSQALWDMTPAEFWITVPALWSDAAKEATFDAATRAGFGSRRLARGLKDSVHIITEPEAAALTVLTEENTSLGNCPRNVLVCDCGGGTVDIVTYKVSRGAGDKLKFEKLLPGEGAMCGSTKIDRNFHDWMNKTFGDHYRNLSPKIKNPSSLFFRSFEDAKCVFTGPNHTTPSMEVSPIPMNAPDSINYDREYHTVILTTENMLGLFQPVVVEILRLIGTQVAAVEKRGSNIEEIFLVGGFGESPYLKAELKKWCAERSIKYNNPWSCQEAIVKGAALRGLLGIKPTRDMSDHHYGYSISMPFREGIDDEAHSWTCPWEGTKWCRHRMECSNTLEQGDCLDDLVPKRFELQRSVFADTMDVSGVINVWVCGSDYAPDSSSDWRVKKLGAVKVEFSWDDVVRSPSRAVAGDLIYQVKYEIEVVLVSERGLLEFSVIVHGATKETTIRYDEGFDTVIR